MGVQACYGGSWGVGAYAGLFCAYAGYAPSGAGSSIGARLARSV
jgi:hypothetical protein